MSATLSTTTTDLSRPFLGALPYEGGILFRVWAPKAARVTLVLEPTGEAIRMRETEGHYFEADVHGLRPGARYRFRLDDRHLYPDPASRYQPEGVHGPSAVVDPGAYTWRDAAWGGVAQKSLVFYELHVGTFTPEGTYDAARARLPYLRDLGVTAIELMPVADFPGRWNWGYDPAAFYAPSRAYGTPDDLRAFVDDAHAAGLAVFLDVVYNHLGPDGAYLAAFAPLFTAQHDTPWGQAINLDDTFSEGVRRLFIDNALHWLREYHFDGLRLDATHALVDNNPRHFLAELAAAVKTMDGPRRYLVAEDHRNLNTLLLPRVEGGYGLDAVWVDDFHHQIRHLTAGDSESYYADYAGMTMREVAEGLERGWYFDGRPSPTEGTPRGTDAARVAREQCVICIQNHDQIGNRPRGNRLSEDVSLNLYRAASALLLFAPQLPLLFMGQEWAASTPFRFFTDHEAELGRKVTEGRKDEFRHFSGFKGEVPDPQDPATFAASRLRWEEHKQAPHSGILALYQALLALRPHLPADFEAEAHGDYGLVARRGPYHLLVAFAGGVTLPVPPDAEIHWHSEGLSFCEDGITPEQAEGQIVFSGPCAVLAFTGKQARPPDAG